MNRLPILVSPIRNSVRAIAKQIVPFQIQSSHHQQLVEGTIVQAIEAVLAQIQIIDVTKLAKHPIVDLANRVVPQIQIGQLRYSFESLHVDLIDRVALQTDVGGVIPAVDEGESFCRKPPDQVVRQVDPVDVRGVAEPWNSDAGDLVVAQIQLGQIGHFAKRPMLDGSDAVSLQYQHGYRQVVEGSGLQAGHVVKTQIEQV